MAEHVFGHRSVVTMGRGFVVEVVAEAFRKRKLKVVGIGRCMRSGFERCNTNRIKTVGTHFTSRIMEHDVVRVDEVDGEQPWSIGRLTPVDAEQPVGGICGNGVIVFETVPHNPVVIAVVVVF